MLPASILLSSLYCIYYCFHCQEIPVAGTSAPAERKKFFSRPEGVLVKLGIIAFCSHGGRRNYV
ncbi:MAG: hypothetical protein WDO16_16055 [Bacteroidota bacterium]